ncbi:MAG TPA: DUF2339 domain-containing protein [Verrucomicrobiae bacterium]
MTFVLVIIALALIAYLAGRVREMRQEIRSLEQRLDRADVALSRLQQFGKPAEEDEENVGSRLLQAREEESAEAAQHTPMVVPIQPRVNIPQTSSYAVAEPPQLASAEPVDLPPLLEMAASAEPALRTSDPISENSRSVRAPEFNWEQFLGAKMLAWLGGLALFVGIAFFVKYSFDRNLIPPWMRVAAGFAIGSGLVVAGLRIRKKDYLITAQTLVATGVVILYAVSFISRSLNHLIDTSTLFLLMSGITVGAFSLAIRLDARVVAVLGMLGGFLTPLFVGFSREQPLALLGYVLVLDCGLLTVAKKKDWKFLIPLAGIATLLTEVVWVTTALRADNLISTLLMFGAITAVFVANVRFNPDADQNEPPSLFAGVLQSLVVLGTFWFVLAKSEAAMSPIILLSTLFFGNVALMALYGMTLHVVPLIFAVSACGGSLALWIHKTGTVLSACIAALLYAGLNALVPAWIAKWRDASRVWPNIASVGGIGLMLFVLFGNANPGWFFWCALLALNVVLLAVAFIRRNLVLALCGTIATAFLSLYWITHLDRAESAVVPLIIIGAFALLYFFAARPFAREAEPQDPNAIYFPAIPAAIPFFLIALLMMRLNIGDPTLLFGFVVLLNLLLIFATPAKASIFPVVGFIGTFMLEAIWFTTGGRNTASIVSLAWQIGFSVLFTFYPLFRKRSETVDWIPWSLAAIAGPMHFLFIYWTTRMLWGVLPYAGIIPAVLGLPAAMMFMVTRRFAADDAERKRFTGIFGGSLLFFITLIFPIQFHRQWVTLGWALEGAALIWLNRRAPTKWLVAVGTGLLTVAFVRLALNPLVFRYYERSNTPLWNWYLYTYGIVAAAMFAAAKWSASSEGGVPLKGLLNVLGTVLVFLLINIQIADLFATGPYLVFEFSGNFARDMTYSIAWSLFALALLIIGVKREVPVVRYAGLFLMGLTLLKLFLHDLTQLDALFRIGAFIGVAIILIFASWMYQRFIAAAKKQSESMPQ